MSYRNQKGSALIQVLIVAGLLSIVALAVSALMESAARERRRVVLFDTLKDVKKKIETNIRDESSWNNTLNESTSGLASCIKKTKKTCTPFGTPVKLILRDASNNVAFGRNITGINGGLLRWNDNGTYGFTATGKPCNTFTATPGAGNDYCLFSYRIVYKMFCPNSDCQDPQLKIVGRLRFNPAPNGEYERYRNLISQGNLTNTTLDDADDGKYDPVVRRTAGIVNPYFSLSMVKTGGAVNDCSVATGAGAGRCSIIVSSPHPLAFEGPTSNTYDNTYGIATTTDGWLSFSFSRTGNYRCTASVAAFATQEFTASIHNVTTNIDVGSATILAGYWSQQNAIIDATFTVANTTDQYRIYQKCENNSPNAQVFLTDPVWSTINECTLGMNKNAYGSSSTIVSLTCYRLDDGM